jgi:hypothetical protein
LSQCSAAAPDSRTSTASATILATPNGLSLVTKSSRTLPARARDSVFSLTPGSSASRLSGTAILSFRA